MIGVVGCGGAGGNFADEAMKHGFYSVAINYSERDLKSLEYVEDIFQLDGSEGVGKNRDLAIELLVRQYDQTINWLKDKFSLPEIKVIAFFFASSGGSGAGIAPLLMDLLQNAMPEKTIVGFPIIPDETEDDTAQTNCISTFEELSRLETALYPIDNQQVKRFNPNIPKNKLYDITNTNGIHILKTLVSYIDKSSKNGNFDERDLLTVLQTKGIGHISEINFIPSESQQSIQLSTQGISTLIHDQWDRSIFAPIEFDFVTRAGVIFDGEERFTELISHPHIFSPFTSGMPVGLYEGYYHESNNKIITILSGLPWINTRLKRIETIIEQNKNKIEIVLTSQLETQYVSSVSKISDKLRMPTKSSTPKRSPAEILAKYKLNK
ncbi:cell division protein FtsZ [Brevibacillus sp. NRS-1366]|uniref:cell division protein FtsZ n=1 Tax=Brevibacillus sp. NRS-1366 TaxID=3233899 RepID=UPI003D216052